MLKASKKNADTESTFIFQRVGVRDEGHHGPSRQNPINLSPSENPKVNCCSISLAQALNGFELLGYGVLLYNKCILFHILHFLCYIMGTILESKEMMDNNAEHLVYKTQTCSAD